MRETHIKKRERERGGRTKNKRILRDVKSENIRVRRGLGKERK